MCKIDFLALIPGRSDAIHIFKGKINRKLNDFKHSIAKQLAYLLPADLLGFIPKRIVQQSGNRFIFAVLLSQCAICKQMRHTGDAACFSRIMAMKLENKLKHLI